MIKVNGNSISGAEGKTVEDWLAETGYNFARIAVELNDRILPRSEYGTATLQSGDVLEVVTFVGGG